MRYRGPYEYDKFTLNILNYINYVNDYIYDMNNTSEEFNTLKKMKDEIDDAFETMTKNSEIIYRYLIMNKGGE
jgi:hypothetical protein